MSEALNTLYVAAAVDMVSGKVILSNLHPNAAELLASFKETLAEDPGISPSIESRIITLQKDSDKGSLAQQIREWVVELTEDAELRRALELAFLEAFLKVLDHVNELKEQALRESLQRIVGTKSVTWVAVALAKAEYALLVSTFSEDKASLEADFAEKVKAKFPGAIITTLPAYPAAQALRGLHLWLAENEIYGAEMTPLIELFCKGMALSAEITANPRSNKDAGIIPII